MSTIEKVPDNAVATITRQDCLVLPYVATSEDKAGQFAAAVETIFFYRSKKGLVETEIFEDGGKWCVAVVKGMKAIDDPVDDEFVTNAAAITMEFDLVENSDDLDHIADMIIDIPPAQEALTKRARRAFRIEDKLAALDAKLDAVLTALVGSEGAKTFGK
jgi:hypothetical protein